jgi:hypothetical protein
MRTKGRATSARQGEVRAQCSLALPTLGRKFALACHLRLTRASSVSLAGPPDIAVREVPYVS